MDGTRTSHLRDLDVHHLIHPLTNWREHQTLGPVIIAEGRGATVLDTEGQSYIDGSACLWNVNVGHGRAELAEVAAAQMKRLAYSPLFTSLSHEPGIALTENYLKVELATPKEPNLLVDLPIGGLTAAGLYER